LAKKSSSLPEKLTRVLKAICEKKVEDLLVLDVSQLVGYTDYFVIGTGQSMTHVQAMAEAAAIAVKEKGKPGVNLEGFQTGNWVLLDAGDFVLHLFQPEARVFYSLEELWADAPRVKIDEKKLLGKGGK